MAATYPGAPLWTGGMSFGAWIAMSVGVEDPRVSAVIGIAPPVCRYDFDAIARSRKAKFLVHGERDEVCSLKDVRAFYARAAEPKELVVIDAADHLCSTARSARSPTRSKIYWEIGQHERSGHRVCGTHGRRQGAERHTARHTGPTSSRRRRSARRCAAHRASRRPRSTM